MGEKEKLRGSCAVGRSGIKNVTVVRDRLIWLAYVSVCGPTLAGVSDNDHGPCDHQRLCNTQSLGISWGYTSFWGQHCCRGHTSLSALTCYPGLWWWLPGNAVEGDVWVHGPTAAEICVYIRGPCYHRRADLSKVVPLYASCLRWRAIPYPQNWLKCHGHGKAA